ncbi:hypothetical protein JMJ77_0011662 [Colletotrichum scovillei]|uniref:Uncharacterized protein n=1 Tax=Colletotrichum scovillei TaxID=1209932 RepID=A0A9P7U832_9PEZI|nr:hypothetical protein JMJ77_0011662 [Colletotrichum scovillei]KAG7045944.1 hypothetical protein JMJ78_0011015 [Colletotrichum scovillei]KAG7063289.1 hypothetical protein JMJ76_0005757 [Colletotrichum scovillei]
MRAGKLGNNLARLEMVFETKAGSW